MTDAESRSGFHLEVTASSLMLTTTANGTNHPGSPLSHPAPLPNYIPNLSSPNPIQSHHGAILPLSFTRMTTATSLTISAFCLLAPVILHSSQSSFLKPESATWFCKQSLIETHSFSIPKGCFYTKAKW